MSSFVVVATAGVGGELRGIKYEPSYVSFRIGEARVVLTVPDARDLLEALPNVLAQHDYAEYVTDQQKAVA